MKDSRSRGNIKGKTSILIFINISSVTWAKNVKVSLIETKFCCSINKISLTSIQRLDFTLKAKQSCFRWKINFLSNFENVIFILCGRLTNGSLGLTQPINFDLRLLHSFNNFHDPSVCARSSAAANIFIFELITKFGRFGIFAKNQFKSTST